MSRWTITCKWYRFKRHRWEKHPQVLVYFYRKIADSFSRNWCTWCMKDNLENEKFSKHIKNILNCLFTWLQAASTELIKTKVKYLLIQSIDLRLFPGLARGVKNRQILQNSGSCKTTFSSFIFTLVLRCLRFLFKLLSNLNCHSSTERFDRVYKKISVHYKLYSKSC